MPQAPRNPHFAIPFRYDANGRPTVEEQGSDDSIISQVKMILAYEMGYDVTAPTFGRPPMLFHQQDETQIASKITDSITAWVTDANVSTEEIRQIVHLFVKQFRVRIAPRGQIR